MILGIVFFSSFFDGLSSISQCECGCRCGLGVGGGVRVGVGVGGGVGVGVGVVCGAWSVWRGGVNVLGNE